MPPKHQENKWKGEQVRDRKDYKKTGNIHNKKVEDYDNWYMGEHQKISATEKNSTALGVNRLSREVNQVGFAKCADVVEPAKMEAQQRGRFATKWPAACTDDRQKQGHEDAIGFALDSAADHKEQGNKHYRASQGAHVDYPPGHGHDPAKWLKETQKTREADAKEEAARKLEAKKPLEDAEGFQTVQRKRAKGGRR